MSEAYTINLPELSPHLVPTDERTLSMKPHTRFYPNEAPPEKFFFYYRLNKHNNDKYRRAESKIWADADRGIHEVIVDTLCDRLGFRPSLKEKVQIEYYQIDRRRAGFQSELVAFCVCMSVADQAVDGRAFETYHPDRKDGNAERFEEVADWLTTRYGIPKNHIIKVYNKLPTLPRKQTFSLPPLLYKPSHN